MGDTGDMVVFPKFHQVPFSKILTFYRRDNFAVESEYDGEVPVIDKKIGHFEIGEVRPLLDGGKKDPANSGEANSAPNPDEPPKSDQDAEMKDAEGSKAAEEAPKKEYRTEKRKKVVSKTIDLPVTSRTIGSLSRDKLEAAIEQEKTLTNQDAYEANRLVAKNSVEEYIYGIREKMCDELEPYIMEVDKDAYSQKLSQTEDWLYEDG